MNIVRTLLPINGHLMWHTNFLRLSCWSCGKEVQTRVSNLFCSHCKVLQKPNDKENYFQLMEMEETYDVDDTYLSKKYKELQRYLHPDKFTNKGEEEKIISDTYSSLVNEAYKTLLEPLSRGIYMLNLRGHDILENTEVDQGFLMKIMEKNEEVEEAETEEEIMRLNDENKQMIRDLQEKLSKAFLEGDIKLITKLLSKMKYYTSIDNQIQSLIRSKGIIK